MYPHTYVLPDTIRKDYSDPKINKTFERTNRYDTPLCESFQLTKAKRIPAVTHKYQSTEYWLFHYEKFCPGKAVNTEK